jgi:4-amino-4-deoxy-L-arabinose transferase-like glycosyltransferase
MLMLTWQKKKLQANTALAIIYTLVLTSAFVFVSTELLSVCNALSSTTLKISWAVYFVAVIYLCIRESVFVSKQIRNNLRIHFNEYRFIKIAVAFILAVTLLISLTAFPNTWDSMTYHLARTMHWLQNKNVEHYPTAVERQVSFPPLAEYWMMHFMCVSGIDKMANLIQWIFFCGTLCAVHQLAGELGASKKGRYLAVFFVATIPMIILQSNSTQNDLVTGFFISTTVLFLILCIKQKFQIRHVMLFAAAVAMACITKGTAYVYLMPVILVFAVSAVIIKKTTAIKIAVISIGIIIFFNGMHWFRNYKTFQSPLGQQYELTNEIITLNGVSSNVIRNIAMHLRLPLEWYNTALNNIVISLHEWIDTDIHAVKYKWFGTPAFIYGTFSLHEDGAGSMLHVMTALLLFVFLVFNIRKTNKLLLLYAAIVLAMFICFCLVLRWQIWHVRLHLPMIILASVFSALMFEKIQAKYATILCILLFLYSLPFLFYNYSRPLIGANNIFYKNAYNQYFFTNMKLQQPFFTMSAIIKRNGLQNIGWAVMGDAWEYPMWKLLEEEKPLRMQHILVTNQTATLLTEQPFASFIPDGIISTSVEPDSLGQMHYKGRDYFLVYSGNGLKFYQDVKTLAYE